MHTKKFLLVPFLFLLLMGVLLFGVLSQTDRALAAPATPAISGHALHATVNATIARRSCPPTLHRGSRGFWVYLLQGAMVNQQIADWTGHFLVIDGRYGERTAYVVSVYQIIQGLDGDGITGPKTWHALGAC